MDFRTANNATENLDPMFGAALVTEDGQELPITMEMIDECLQSFIAREEQLTH
ncbi:hypothetical protein [Parendozoicomonas haliclonae]|nr:hypothetical protein [Parendozoicomonas haliclonae]